MTDYSKEIFKLLNEKGKNAPNMTSALKKIGNGDMQKGLNTLANYCKNSGITIGEKSGWLIGSATTLGVTLAIGSGLYLADRYKKYKAKKEIESEGEKIYEALKETIDEEENEGGEKMTREELKEQIDELMRQYADEEIDGDTYAEKMMELTTSAQNETNED